jgi:UDP-N-acetylmuramyl pentapeptide phosphotransferase/UDP-N-acetylglucosamine-1-phosphate transferase
MHMAVLLALAAGALVLSALSVALIRKWAAHRLLDVPNERSSHTRPTPRGGGLAIAVLTLAGTLCAGPFVEWSPLQLAAFVAAGALIAGISLLDDIRSLRTVTRFTVHLAAAVMAVLAFGPFERIALPFASDLPLGLLGWPLTIVWIAGLTNAYNFMDGIDGIAAMQAAAAALLWAVVGFASGATGAAVVATLLGATSLGFLAHNWPPAKIFMGDVGSAFLGFTFAVLPLTVELPGGLTPVVALLAVWPFVFDTAFTFLRRLRKGENVFAAHRSHLYQRLVIAGWRHRTVTLSYTALALAGGVVALLLPRIALPFVAVGSVLLWGVVVAVERKAK